jgi:hypothetical protein
MAGLLGRFISPSQGRYLHTGQHKHRINADTHQTSMPCVRFELTIPASERAKTVHALDPLATVTCSRYITYIIYFFGHLVMLFQMQALCAGKMFVDLKEGVPIQIFWGTEDDLEGLQARWSQIRWRSKLLADNYKSKGFLTLKPVQCARVMLTICAVLRDENGGLVLLEYRR